MLLIVQAGAPTVISRLSVCHPDGIRPLLSPERDHQEALPVLTPRAREVGWSVAQEEPRACRLLVYAPIEKRCSREK